MIDAATILVADDNADDVELLRRAVKKAGLRNPLHVVSDGNEAIDYLKNESGCHAEKGKLPLLLLLDLNMPRCTGFGVLHWLREHPDLHSLPTIIFANSDADPDIDHCFRLGAHGYWVKPSRFEDLVQMMSRLKELLDKVTHRLDAEQRRVAIAA